MNRGFLICRRDPLPVYFSPKVGKKMGAGHNGWTSDPEEAMGFARADDAKSAADTFLPQLAPACTYPLHTFKDTNGS